MFLRTAIAASLLAVTVAQTASSPANSQSACRCFPGDPCWPSPSTWDQFNQSIGGQLIQTVPLGTPCHLPNYNVGECSTLKNGWLLPQEHYDSSSSVMAPFFANGSCDPFHPISKPCTLGNYVVYAVNVTTPVHISQALQFANQHNIRVVVRNTGHDYNGKSTGAGALGIWMHNLKDISVIDWQDSHYTGKAMTMGAGVQGFEAYDAADKAGVQVVGGECPTVGLAGGYSQGAGHSHLASRWGLGADQVLQWEVVDGSGNFITATRDNQYSDLYWALCGGGGGTYGVVYSMTSKAHPGSPVSGLQLSFNNSGISQDTFYEAISNYHPNLPALVDAGAMSIWFYTNTTFAISPLTGPNIPVDQLISLLSPFTDSLKQLNIQYTMSSGQYPSYLAFNQAMQRVIEVGTSQYGGWLIPRSVVENNNAALSQAYREITEDGATFIGVGLNVSKQVSGDVYNTVLPAWRDALISTTLSTNWVWDDTPDMLAEQKKMTDVYLPKLENLAPNSGAYMNEGDFRQPNWQQAFYGANYGQLRQIKAKYDPNDLFYGKTAVGSDEWAERYDGRLCRTADWQPGWTVWGARH